MDGIVLDRIVLDRVVMDMSDAAGFRTDGRG